MLPYKFNVVAPYIRDKTRLLALSSGNNFGYNELNDEHLMTRLDNFIGNLDNEETYVKYYNLRSRKMPIIGMPNIDGKNTNSDILLNDTFRHHSEISNRYRKNMAQACDIRAIIDGATRYHISNSRGYERHLVNFISRLDNEMADRQTIKPHII